MTDEGEMALSDFIVAVVLPAAQWSKCCENDFVSKRKNMLKDRFWASGRRPIASFRAILRDFERAKAMNPELASLWHFGHFCHLFALFRFPDV